LRLLEPTEVPEFNGKGDGYVELSEYAREGPGPGVNGDSLENTMAEFYPALGTTKGSVLVDPYPDPVDQHPITNPVY